MSRRDADSAPSGRPLSPQLVTPLTARTHACTNTRGHGPCLAHLSIRSAPYTGGPGTHTRRATPPPLNPSGPFPAVQFHSPLPSSPQAPGTRGSPSRNHILPGRPHSSSYPETPVQPECMGTGSSGGEARRGEAHRTLPSHAHTVPGGRARLGAETGWRENPRRKPVPSAGQPLGPGQPVAGWLSAAARLAASASAAAGRARAGPRPSVL